MSETYTRLTLSIRPAAGERHVHAVEAELDDGRVFRGELAIDHEELLAASPDPEAYGLLLFKALFRDRIRDAYTAAVQLAESETEKRLRIRLEIDQAAPELHALPWERLYHIHRGRLIPLAATALTPFSRYTPLEIADPEPLDKRPVGLLFVISNPKGLPPALAALNVEAETGSLVDAVGDLQVRGGFRVTVLPGRTGLSAETTRRLESAGIAVAEGAATLDRILHLLESHRLLHFLGHGWYRRTEGGEGRATLFLESEGGEAERVHDDELGARLAALESQPQLVFLAACESAKREAGGRHPFVGLAPKLVRSGVPAVVAMQDRVPMDMARTLTADFYRGLLQHGLVDRALNEARAYLFSQEKTDWAIPVLFMRLRDGRLLASDPVRDALAAIVSRARDKRPSLPVEVVHFDDPGRLGGLRETVSDPRPARDLIEALRSIFARWRDEGEKGGLVVLVGEHGSTRSTQMLRLARLTAAAALEEGAERIVPVYVDFAKARGNLAGARNPLEPLILEELAEFWPGLTTEVGTIAELPSDVVLRVLFDGGEELSDRSQRHAWRWVQETAREHPGHQFCLTVEASQYDAQRLKHASDLLVIQTLTRQVTARFLRLKGDVGHRLLRVLEAHQLFDLAGIPWLLFKMLGQAAQGLYPRSRSEVLSNLLDDATTEIPTSQGLRSRTARTLAALAWRMHQRRARDWPIEATLETIAEKRGRREYGLEELLEHLVECGLLSRVGDESIRFAYPAIQSFCCASWIAAADGAERERMLDDIGASLGRLTRLRWWDETLVLLCGIQRNPNTVLRPVLYGASLAEGEEVFLAVRCILESRATPGSKPVAEEVLHQVVDTLVWRLDPSNVGVTSRRMRAVRALGRLGEPSAIGALARVANQKLRVNWQGEYSYDYSIMRMGAAIALERMMDRHAARIEAVDPAFHDVLTLWRKRDIDALVERLHSGSPESTIAAFALGHMRGDDAERAEEELIGSFLAPDTSAASRWAVADALTLLSPDVVLHRAVLPYLVEGSVERGELSPRAWRQRSHRYDCLAYLIGVINARHEATAAFLDRCLKEFSGIAVKARALQSLGWMTDHDSKELLERIAAGKLRELNLSDSATAADRRYLRSKAIGALALLGDHRTIRRLRESRVDWHPELERALYWASEEISWRLSTATG